MICHRAMRAQRSPIALDRHKEFWFVRAISSIIRLPASHCSSSRRSPSPEFKGILGRLLFYHLLAAQHLWAAQRVSQPISEKSAYCIAFDTFGLAIIMPLGLRFEPSAGELSMRVALLAAIVSCFCLPAMSWAQHPIEFASSSCTQCAPAIVAQPMPILYDACNSCNTCDSCAQYAGLGSNHAEFYRRLYADFYAKNAWYVEYRQREDAARRERLYGASRIPQPQTQSKPKAAPQSILK